MIIKLLTTTAAIGFSFTMENNRNHPLENATNTSTFAGLNTEEQKQVHTYVNSNWDELKNLIKESTLMRILESGKNTDHSKYKDLPVYLLKELFEKHAHHQVIKKHMEDAQKLQSSIKTLESKLNTLQYQETISKSEKNDLNLKIIEVEKLLKEEKNYLTNEKQQHLQKIQQIENLTNDVNAKAKQIQDLQKDLDTNKQTIQELNKSVNEKEQQIENLTNDVNAKAKQIQDLQKDLDTNKQTIQELKSDLLKVEDFKKKIIGVNEKILETVDDLRKRKDDIKDSEENASYFIKKLREDVSAIEYIETNEQKILKKELDTFINKYDESKKKFKDDEGRIYRKLLTYQKLIWKLDTDKDIQSTLENIKKSNESMIEIFKKEKEYFEGLIRSKPNVTKTLDTLKNTRPGWLRRRFIGSTTPQQQGDQKTEQEFTIEQKENNSQTDEFYNYSPKMSREQTSNSIKKYESDIEEHNLINKYEDSKENSF
jgi:chromosome segregation ATPase